MSARLKKRRMTPHEYQRTRALLSGTGDFSGFGGAQIVIEAVYEDLGVKRQVIADVEAAVPPHVIIATNTSTIPIQDIAAGQPRDRPCASPPRAESLTTTQSSPT